MATIDKSINKEYVTSEVSDQLKKDLHIPDPPKYLEFTKSLYYRTDRHLTVGELIDQLKEIEDPNTPVVLDDNIPILRAEYCARDDEYKSQARVVIRSAEVSY